MLSKNEKTELEELRRYKLEHEGKAMTRAFARLETLLESAHDPVISIRAFRVMAECLLVLRDEVNK
jgi:hypothetical protein